MAMTADVSRHRGRWSSRLSLPTRPQRYGRHRRRARDDRESRSTSTPTSGSSMSRLRELFDEVFRSDVDAVGLHAGLPAGRPCGRLGLRAGDRADSSPRRQGARPRGALLASLPETLACRSENSAWRAAWCRCRASDEASRRCSIARSHCGDAWRCETLRSIEPAAAPTGQARLIGEHAAQDAPGRHSGCRVPRSPWSATAHQAAAAAAQSLGFPVVMKAYRQRPRAQDRTRRRRAQYPLAARSRTCRTRISVRSRPNCWSSR